MLREEKDGENDDQKLPENGTAIRNEVTKNTIITLFLGAVNIQIRCTERSFLKFQKVQDVPQPWCFLQNPKVG
jgi:hypothetical protein